MKVVSLYIVKDGRTFTKYVDAERAAKALHMASPDAKLAFSRESAILVKMALASYNEETREWMYFHLLPVKNVDPKPAEPAKKVT